MLRLFAVSLAGIAATLMSFGLSAKTAIAQTVFPFDATYNTQSVFEEVVPGILQITVKGESEIAPYGLTNLLSLSYGQLNLDTGELITTQDPARFGNNDLPFGENKIFNSNSDDSVFIIESATRPSPIDFENQTASIFSTLTITGGSGRFSGATGTLNFSVEDVLTSDSTAFSKGRARYSGDILTPQAVPESRNTMTLLAIGVIGVGFGLHRRRLGVVG